LLLVLFFFLSLFCLLPFLRWGIWLRQNFFLPSFFLLPLSWPPPRSPLARFLVPHFFFFSPPSVFFFSMNHSFLCQDDRVSLLCFWWRARVFCKERPLASFFPYFNVPPCVAFVISWSPLLPGRRFSFPSSSSTFLGPDCTWLFFLRWPLVSPNFFFVPFAITFPGDHVPFSPCFSTSSFHVDVPPFAVALTFFPLFFFRSLPAVATPPVPVFFLR